MMRLELLELFRDRATRWVLLTMFVAIAIALAHGAHHYRHQLGAVEASMSAAQHHRVQAREQAAMLNRDPAADVPYWKDPRDVAGYATFQMMSYATKPPLPLAVLNIGQSDLYPYYFALNIDSREKAAGSHEIYNPDHLQAGHFDVAFVAIFLLPLALIALAHGVGARERHSSMHALVLVATARPWLAWLRRMAWRALALWNVLALTLIAAMILQVIPGWPWSELVQFLGLALLYLCFWGAAIAALSFASRTPASSALNSLGVWMALLIAVPAIASFAAHSFAPVPPRAAFVQASRDATDEINRERLDLLEKYFIDHPQYSPADPDLDRLPFTITRIVTVQELERRTAGVAARYEDALSRQERLVDTLAPLSPGLWLQNALNRLSGADLERQRNFAAQTGAYHRKLRDFFYPRILALTKQQDYRICVDCPAATRSADHLDFPQYSYAPFRSAVLASNSGATGLIALLLSSIALLFCAARNSLRVEN